MDPRNKLISTLEGVLVDPPTFEHHMSAFGFRIARAEEIAPALAFAERLVGQPLAPEAVVRRVHEHCGITVWIYCEPHITGFATAIPLTRAGEIAMRNRDFDPADPDLSHVCPASERAAAFYCWVYGGETRDARRAVMMAAATLRVQLFGTVPAFARGATEDGVRTMEQMGYTPLAGSLDKLYVQEALFPAEAAA